MRDNHAGFETASREKVTDRRLAIQLHVSTGNSLVKTASLIEQTPQWQALRAHARQVKLHTLTHLDEYVQRFAAAAERNGATVSWAATGEDACAQTLAIARQHGVRRITKAKSMTSEEIGLNEALEAGGLEPVETDFGEMICQLAHVAPSHVTAPIIQWSIEEVARLLARVGYVDAIPPELQPGGGALDRSARLSAAARLVTAARVRLREKFMTAGMGISGANFAVADRGALVLVENEANIRLTTTLPGVHVAVVGIDKLIPRTADLGTFLTLLPVAATGQRQTSYVTFLRKPLGRLHIILLDNGRLNVLADEQHFDLLSCIRCGACMNACPVYRHVSGHGYEAVYPGPIGAALMPHLQPGRAYEELPFASSLCGACTEICPVGIPLHERLLEWRERVVGRGERSRLEAAAFAGWTWLMTHPTVYRSGRPPAAWINAMAGWFAPVKQWQKTRELPQVAGESFAQWWRKHRDA